MPFFSRRDVLKGGAIVAGSFLLPVSFKAFAVQNNTKGLTRYNVSSPEGKAMLKIYAQAVAKMMNASLYPEGNPLNWEFQWYTHFVRGDRKKAGEIARIYPSNSAYKTLAQQMWNTCHAHSPNQREDFFLPWHRIFITCFENIIRHVSGEPQFTLPWWDYTDSNQQSIPEEFRRPNDPLWGALYRSDRKETTNAGENIARVKGGLQLTLECMRHNVYSGKAGFCSHIDQDPHGALHVDVGNNEGMGSVPWAARDPVFWIHHANIDRIWASWNRAGGKNPDDEAFTNAVFTFATPQGSAVVAQVKDYLSIAPDAYSAWALRPQQALAFAQESQTMAQKPALVATQSQITLGDKPVTLELKAEPGSVSLFSQRLQSGQNHSQQVLLTFEGLSAHSVVNGGYNVYVHGNKPGVLSLDSPTFVGQINFFGASGTHHHEEDQRNESASVPPKAFSLILSSKTLAMLAAEKITQPKISLVPTANGNEQAMPMISKIELIIQ